MNVGPMNRNTIRRIQRKGGTQEIDPKIDFAREVV